MNKTNLACFPVLFFLVSRCLRPLVVGSAKCGICWRTYKAQESNPGQCSNPYLPANAKPRLFDQTALTLTIRSGIHRHRPHIFSPPLSPRVPYSFGFFPLPCTLIPCFLPFPTPPLLSLNKFHHTAQEFMNMIFFFSVVVFVRLYRATWKKSWRPVKVILEDTQNIASQCTLCTFSS